jgi:flagellin-like protein
MRSACARQRKSEEAVTPVIATILMVAITVVLAAVLYAMIGIFFDLDVDIKHVIATVDSTDKNWTIQVIEVQGGPLVTSDIQVLVMEADLDIGLQSTLLSEMQSGAYYNGVRYIETSTAGYLEVGDRITLDKGIYVQGSEISLVTGDGESILWEKKL